MVDPLTDRQKSSAESTTRAEDDVIVGIDLGTTNSLIAVVDKDRPRCLTDHLGRALLPSVVRLMEGSRPIVGVPARDHAVEFPTETIGSIKRLMGKSAGDLREDLPFLSYEVVEGDHQTARVKAGERVYSPPEISAMILRRLKEIAEGPSLDQGGGGLGRPVCKAVVTVPAYFDDAQRQATRDAGRLAGLEVVRIINEPTAAALAYGLGRPKKVPETIAVYDLGGGTFDITILRIIPEAHEDIGPGTPADSEFFQVLATAGDTHLGGDDVDWMLMRLLMEELTSRYGASVTITPATQQTLRRLAESAKIALTSQTRTEIHIEVEGKGFFDRVIQREELEVMMRPWVDRTLACCGRAIRDARIDAKEISRVVMVGGCTRIPLVQQMVGRFFGTTPYTALNPDEVVALGAAIQGSILSGRNRSALLLDVIPLSLGIETVGGGVAKLILRNSAVPIRAREVFTTSVDNQTGIDINILQGEREMVKDCRSLGRFQLRGLPPMPAGIPQVEVTFHIDANGILDVSAMERRSGQAASIQIVPNHGLTREEVNRMEQESIVHAREDMHMHRVVDLRVNAALDVKWITERIDKVGQRLDAEYRASLSQQIAIVKGFLRQSETNPECVDADAFQRAKESLDRTSMRLHEIAITETIKSM